MKKFVLAITLFSLLAGISAAQAQEADWFWNKTIASIQWEGVKKANRNELDAVMRSYIGKAFTEELWLEMQSKLYDLDWFETIEPQALPSETEAGKLVIRFVVKEKPSILSIKVTGNSTVKTSEILGAVTAKTGDIFNPVRANMDDEAIQKLYFEKGYPDAVASHEAKPSADDPGLLNLVFNVTEGSQVAIRHIQFSGNDNASERTLKGLVTLKEAALFQSGAYQESKLEESKSAIVDYYQSKGFVDARIADVVKNLEKESATGKNYLTLTFVISEGKPWTFGGIAFSGNHVFSEEKLRSLVTLKAGAPLNYKRLLQDKQKIDDLYFESGYIYNRIDLQEKRDETAATISYTVEIEERDRAHIETLNFKGNAKTKQFVLAREVPLEEGDIFSKAKILEGLRNLYNLQYFSVVEPDIHQGSAENLMDLTINVEEMSTSEIQFGVTLTGLGSESKFPLSGFVKWNDRNLGGNGQNLQANVTLSPTEQSLDTSFGESWLFGKRISGSVGLSVKHSSETTGQDIIGPVFDDIDIPDPFTGLGSGTDQWNGSLSSIPSQYLMPYQNYSFNLSFNMGYTHKTGIGDLGLGAGITSGLGMIKYDEDKYRPYELEFRETNGSWLFNNRLSARLYLNDLDYWYNPGSGYFLSQRFTLAGVIPAERQHYTKSESRLEGYLTLFTIPITENWKFKMILAARSGVQALFGHPWNSFKVTQDWISLDGTFNARGWKDLYGLKGTTLWENSLELRMPIVEQAVWMDLFVDAGAMKTETGLVDMTLDSPAADPSRPSFSDLGWSNMAFSTGFGFRFTVPQFPFRFYLVKRFTYDGSKFAWKTPGANFDFVLSITQPLY